MHLSLLRDGVIKGWVHVNELQMRITDYTNWVDKYYGIGYSCRTKENQSFNYVNEYVQAMQVGVLRFRETWPYFDPTVKKYQPPVKVSFTGQTYFSISGSLGNQSPAYTLPTIPAGPLTNIDVYWVEQLCNDYNMLLGTQSITPTRRSLTRLTIGNAVPPSPPCDPNNDDFCYFKNGAAVSPDNPVVAVQGVYDTAGALLRRLRLPERLFHGTDSRPEPTGLSDSVQHRPAEGLLPEQRLGAVRRGVLYFRRRHGLRVPLRPPRLGSGNRAGALREFPTSRRRGRRAIRAFRGGGGQ